MAALMGIKLMSRSLHAVYSNIYMARRIMWLKVGVTNNDPNVIAHFYVECVKTIQGGIAHNLHDPPVYTDYHHRSSIDPADRPGY